MEGDKQILSKTKGRRQTKWPPFLPRLKSRVSWRGNYEHFQACASAQVWPQRLCLQVSYEELTYFIANGRILTGGQVQDGYALAEDALWELGYVVLPVTIQDRTLETWRNNHPEDDDPAQPVLGLLSDDPQYLQAAISMLTG